MCFGRHVVRNAGSGRAGFHSKSERIAAGVARLALVKYWYSKSSKATVAQLAEQRFRKPQVVGSTPTRGSILSTT